ncbi:MAG: hypothetical protein U0807_18895 [Candidatus Binatia bacterium]
MFIAIAIATQAAAKPSTAQKCLSAKERATSAWARARFACAATGIQSGLPADPGCVGRAQSAADRLFTHAEKKGACFGVVAAVDGVMSQCVANLGAGFSGDPRCGGGKLRAVGKRLGGDLACLAAATLKGVAVAGGCRQQADASFAAAFKSAERKGTCAPPQDALRAAADACFAALQVPFGPPTTTVPTTTMTTSTATTTTFVTTTTTTVPPCHPVDVSGFTPTYHHPNPAHQGLCTVQQVQGFYDSCLTGDATTCSTFLAGAGAGACSACLQTPATATTWGPIVSYPSIQLNASGCIEILDPTPRGLACAQSFQAAQECARAACIPSCGDPTTLAEIARLNACILEATSGGCATYTEAYTTSCSVEPVTVAPCVETDPETAVLGLGELFCL